MTAHILKATGTKICGIFYIPYLCFGENANSALFSIRGSHLLFSTDQLKENPRGFECNQEDDVNSSTEN